MKVFLCVGEDFPAPSLQFFLQESLCWGRTERAVEAVEEGGLGLLKPTKDDLLALFLIALQITVEQQGTFELYHRFCNLFQINAL